MINIDIFIVLVLTPRKVVSVGGHLKLGPKFTETVALLCIETVGKYAPLLMSTNASP